MTKIIKSKYFWLGLIFVSITGCILYISANWVYVGPEELVLVERAFMCRGPDKDGNPTAAVEEFSRTDWEEIYLCVYVVPEGQATLWTFWIYNKDGRAFANGSLVRIYESQYLFFSFRDAVEEGNKAYYFQEELESREFPTGEYSALLKQIRTPLITVDFDLTH